MSDEFNPYQSPSSELSQDSVYSMEEQAGKGRRFGTLLVDYFGLTLLGGILGAGIGIFFGEAGVRAVQGVPDIVFGVILTLTYYMFFEAIWARTPGKLIFGTVVVTESGAKPPFGQIFKRTACRLIPFEAFSFFGELGWHDKLSDTRVVRKRKSSQ